ANCRIGKETILVSSTNLMIPPGRVGCCLHSSIHAERRRRSRPGRDRSGHYDGGARRLGCPGTERRSDRRAWSPVHHPFIRVRQRGGGEEVASARAPQVRTRREDGL